MRTRTLSPLSFASTAALIGVASLLLTSCTNTAGNEPNESDSASVTPTVTASSPSPAPTDATDEPVSPSEPVPTTGAPEPSEPTIPGASAALTLATVDGSTGDILVGGFVSGVLEDGGACTFTVTAKTGGASALAETVGSGNVDSTTCGSAVVEPPAAGPWTVVLTYKNSQGSVSSTPVDVDAS